MLAALLVLAVCGGPDAGCFAQDTGATIRQIVDQVQRSVVRLRVIGGTQVVDGESVSSLVTTGVVISDKGEILTSAFALQGKPDAVFVEKADGTRVSAKIVATDLVRRLVLLRADGEGWVPIKSADRDSVQVGQYAIALGRFYQSPAPTVSVGIVSALNRIHGLAIQTDARISPVNYGGPLVGLSGEAMGILVPLSPRGRGNATTGIEWYDSGIGFAIPLTDALQVAERLRGGTDLRPGLMGLSLAANGAFSGRVTVGRILPGGPAATAGLREGDRLIKINDKVVERVAIPEEILASRYAGDVIQLQVERDQQPLNFSLTLVDRLPEVNPGYLGLLTFSASKVDAAAIAAMLQPDAPQPLKAEAQGEKAPGTELKAGIRGVALPEGVLGKAGAPLSLEVTEVNGRRLTSEAALMRLMPGIIAGAELGLKYRLPGSNEEQSLQVVAGRRPQELPVLSEEVLRQWGALTSPSENVSAEIQRSEVEIEGRGRCVIVTTGGSAQRNSGLIVLLSEHATQEDQILNRWKALLSSHGLQLVIPLNPEKSALTDADVPLVLSSIQQVASANGVDLRRTILVAAREQSVLARQLAFDARSPVRGIVLTSGWIPGAELEGIDGRGAAVLLLDGDTNAASRVLREESAVALKRAGFWVPKRRMDASVEQNIADLSILLRSL